MYEIISRAEMNERFPAEWLLIGDPKTSSDLEVVSGKVLWHSTSRDEVYDKATELRPNSCAFLYTGDWPEGMDFVL